ncbi:MAG: SIR2 family protein [Actinomycetota bacterium]|nr:SIR2 family protein [Actinomycetota bacterium]
MLVTNSDRIVERLSEQIARNQVVLFTGAGFSFGAQDASARDVPQVAQLKAEIWELLWSGEPVAADSTLANTYAAALAQAKNRLSVLLRERLRVSPASVSAEHLLWLSVPWRRAYTINIDDLESAAERRFVLPRGIRSVSATRGAVPLDAGNDLLYVHLNGTIEDVPDHVTFADPQYGARHLAENPLYEKLAADLVSYTVVFVGTQLQESLFWEYLALRDARGVRGTSEMRPRSYLVTPELPRDREVLLGSYNIEWVKATAVEFANEVLRRLEVASAVGHQRRMQAGAATGRVVLPRVSELASLPAAPGSEFLLGAQPEWSDLTDGRTVERQFENEIDVVGRHGCLLVTGTAGAGTSTVLKRLALRFAAEGRDTRWIDGTHGFNARELSRHLRDEDNSLVVVMDDADTFGVPLGELVSDVLRDQEELLLVLGMRATRVDRVLPGWQMDERRQEVNVPLLEDPDIDGLLAILDRHNRLGALRPMSAEQRRTELRHNCGRELLVAMIQATSGLRFEAKIASEYTDLDPLPRLLYGAAAIATELRIALTRDELLSASGEITNEALYAVDRLIARKLLVERPSGYEVRHRRIAELLVAGARNSGTLFGPYAGLTRAIAIRASPDKTRSRENRLLTALISHERVRRSFSMNDARRLYDSVEAPLATNYHFWLQRGSLEVENGSLPAARNYLQQAFAGGGDNDHRVHTEWAYYLIKSAYSDPRAANAAEQVAEGERILLDAIDRRGGSDPYSCHVYGSQMLAWLRRAPLGDSDRARKLEAVMRKVGEGRDAEPHVQDLQILHRDLENEWLLLAVQPEDR